MRRPKEATKRLIRVPRSMQTASLMILTHSLKETLRAQRKDSQENNVTGQNLVTGIDPCPEGLGDTENYSTEEGSPEIPQPPNDDRFKGEDQSGRSDRRIEICADAEENACDGDDCE